MEVESRSPYKTTRTLNKLIGAFVIAHDVERALERLKARGHWVEEV